MTTGTFEESIQAFQRFLSERAFQEGYAAYLAGAARTAIPDRLNVYSGNWVEGWLAAAHDAKATADCAPQISVEGPRIPLLHNGIESISMSLN